VLLALPLSGKLSAWGGGAERYWWPVHSRGWFCRVALNPLIHASDNGFNSQETLLHKGDRVLVNARKPKVEPGNLLYFLGRMRECHLSSCVNCYTADEDTRPKLHSTRIPIYAATSKRYVDVLRFDPSLFDQALVLILMVYAIKLPKPFRAWVVRLDSLEIISMVRTAGIEPRETVIHLPLKMRCAWKDWEVEANIRACIWAIFLVDILRQAIKCRSQVAK
jgi:hypothetical protein